MGPANGYSRHSALADNVQGVRAATAPLQAFAPWPAAGLRGFSSNTLKPVATAAAAHGSDDVVTQRNPR
jgi:hypothetical protein